VWEQGDVRATSDTAGCVHISLFPGEQQRNPKVGKVISLLPLPRRNDSKGIACDADWSIGKR